MESAWNQHVQGSTESPIVSSATSVGLTGWLSNPRVIQTGQKAEKIPFEEKMRTTIKQLKNNKQLKSQKALEAS